MDITEVKEFQRQVPMTTIAFVIVIAVVGFVLGYEAAKVEGSDEQQHLLHNFTIDEVNGVRSDWMRDKESKEKQRLEDIDYFKSELIEVRKRLEKLESK